jgi:uncharacterized protein (DUF1499 family)
MRHVIIEEPYSEAALWSRRLAVFALAVAGIGLLLTRTGLEPVAVFAVVGSAILIACLAVLCAGAAFVSIWQTGRKGVGLGLAGLAVALVLLAYPAYLAVQAIALPVLNDISTDIDDPPSFSLSRKALAARHGFSPSFAEEGMRVLQANIYPDIQPVVLDLEGDEAYQAVLKAIAAQRWTIVDDIKPGRRSYARHIDALARGPLLGFSDDVTIRIRPLAGQSRIDIRSVSRFGRHDFGANARRIAAFIEELNAQTAAK